MADSRWRFEIPFAGKRLTTTFDGGHLSSDGGLVLLQRVDEQLGLTARLAQCLRDERDQNLVEQSVLDLLRQRIFGIVCGYEDCNDFDTLRTDALFKLAVGRQPLTGADLGSQPTLSRLENAVGPKDLLRMSAALVEMFVEGHHGAPPQRIILDADATDDPTHGQQEFEFYHGYYDHHCYLPLLVYATADGGEPACLERSEQELVAAVLQPGNVHAGHRAVAVLRRIVERLRAAFPDSEILLRGDAGLALPAVYDYCEGAGLSYVISLAKNSRLLAQAEPLLREAEAIYAETGEKVRHFGEFTYAADSWPHPRRVVVKAEVTGQGENPRFVVTNLEGPDAEAIYDELYTKAGRCGEPHQGTQERSSERAHQLSQVSGQPISAAAARGGVRADAGLAAAAGGHRGGGGASRHAAGEAAQSRSAGAPDLAAHLGAAADELPLPAPVGDAAGETIARCDLSRAV